MYARLKPADRGWAEAWQREVHAALTRYEDVVIDPSAFVSPDAHLFAEPGRAIVIGPGAAVGAEVFVHGPVTVGAHTSLNPRVVLDGGRAGVVLGQGVRVATGASLFAFDHGTAADLPIREQPVRSRGIRVGDDVWIGANAGITDGVTVGDGAVVAMGAVVTHDVEPGWLVGGVPARPLRRR